MSSTLETVVPAATRESPGGGDWRALVEVVQQLSMARDLDGVMAIVRRAARELTGADGASFVLRDQEQCYYAEENAIAPLWKGMRFPMDICVSGWVMLNRQPAVIEDIYSDPRVPTEAYRPTFVKSMAMVPIRTQAPLGAIGNYWATRHAPTEHEVAVLAALADTTSVAMENVQLYQELEQRVRERTRALELANKELESFSYAVSHDLRAPLRAVNGFSRILREEQGDRLDDEGRDLLNQIEMSGSHMNTLIESLLSLSRLSRAALNKQTVDLGPLIETVMTALRRADASRQVELTVGADLSAEGDPALLRIVLDNLLSNAWKYSSKRPDARIEVGRLEAMAAGAGNGAAKGDGEAAVPTYFVRDNGAGFKMAYAERLFAPFQRLHSAEDFPGTGVGLATVQRIIRRHGGRIWVEAAPNEGATFFFTLSGASGEERT